jgi:hypothetical protein
LTKKFLKASRPPAEAPTPITKCGLEVMSL